MLTIWKPIFKKSVFLMFLVFKGSGLRSPLYSDYREIPPTCVFLISGRNQRWNFAHGNACLHDYSLCRGKTSLVCQRHGAPTIDGSWTALQEQSGQSPPNIPQRTNHESRTKYSYVQKSAAEYQKSRKIKIWAEKWGRVREKIYSWKSGESSC